MPYSRRGEAFRYNFAIPVKGEFKITKIDGVEVESGAGELKIIDISLHGAKISAPYDFHVEEKNIELTLQFQVMSILFLIPGQLVYHERHVDGHRYGVHLHTDESTREQLVSELKAYARNLARKKSL